MKKDKEKKDKKDKHTQSLGDSWIYFPVEATSDTILDIGGEEINESVQDYADNSGDTVFIVNNTSATKPDIVTTHDGETLPYMTLFGANGEYQVQAIILGGSHPTTTPPPRPR